MNPDRRKSSLIRIKSEDSRMSGNLVSFLVTCTVLFVTVKFTDGNFTARINEISKTLDKALFDVLDMKEVNYTELDDGSSVIYNSNLHFNPRGMAGLYNVTERFINLIISKNIIPEDVIKVSNGTIRVDSFQERWQELLSYYSGLLVVVLILLLFAIFLPLCGFCFCCCRCCGNCGARSKPFDKKHDLCKKILLATLLIALGTLLLFGVVCAFVNNQHMEEGQSGLVDNLHVNIDDTKKYLYATKEQIDIVFIKNCDEFTDFMFEILGKTSEIVYDRLTEMSNAIALTEITNIVNGLSYIRGNLTILRNSTNDLRVNASQLNDALRKVKRDLLSALSKCQKVPTCTSLVNNHVSKLGSDIDFDSLPDIQTEISELDDVMNSGIETAVQEGYDQLVKIKSEIEVAVEKQLKQVQTTITHAGEQIKFGAENVTIVLKDAEKYLDDANKNLNTYDEYAKQYAPYRYYIGLLVSCILLLITICIALGLICGVCGKRPDAYGDDCCNKGAGSRFLMCAVLIMFLFGIVLVVVTLIYFIIGIVAQRVVCETLRNPNDSHVLEVANGLVAQYSPLKDVNISSVLISCHRNESIYKVLKLKNKFDVEDVDEYINKYNISNALAGLEAEIKAHTKDIKILNQKAKNDLTKLSESGISDINFDKFKSVMDYNFTSVNLNYLADELEKLIDILGDDVKVVIETDLRLSVLHLRTYQTRLVDPMNETATQMIQIASDLEEGLKFNRSSFKDAIISLIDEVSEAEIHLQEHGTVYLIEIAHKFSVSLENHVRKFLKRVVNHTVEHIGQCGPMSLVLNSTLTSTCDKILLPINGFWFGVFWSLILFVPTIIVSVKLATLYQKYNPYSGPLIEAEYLYDAYTDRDSIPLSSADYSHGKNSKKKQKKKNKRHDDRAVAGPGGDIGGGLDYAGGSHQDARYADMAPKHWEEFPSGGPPQYQRAPTEYERPPPYYYPGSGEHQ